MNLLPPSPRRQPLHDRAGQPLDKDGANEGPEWRGLWGPQERLTRVSSFPAGSPVLEEADRENLVTLKASRMVMSLKINRNFRITNKQKKTLPHSSVRIEHFSKMARGLPEFPDVPSRGLESILVEARPNVTLPPSRLLSCASTSSPGLLQGNSDPHHTHYL